MASFQGLEEVLELQKACVSVNLGLFLKPIVQIGFSIGELSDRNQNAAMLPYCKMFICLVQVIFGSAHPPAVQWKDRLSLGNGFHLAIRQVGVRGVFLQPKLFER